MPQRMRSSGWLELVKFGTGSERSDADLGLVRLIDGEISHHKTSGSK